MFKPRQDKPAGVIAIGYRVFWLLDGFNGDPGVAQIPVVALVAMSAIFNIEHTGIVE